MNKVDRMKILVRYAISNGIANNQKELGVKLGYNNESAFSQIINCKVNPPKVFYIKLKSVIPNVNVNWIETGEGNMICVDATASSLQEIEQKTALNKSDVVLIPVLNLDVRGGYSDNENTDIREYVDGMIPFSNKIARNGDFVIPLFGDSMYPRYPSGSQLLVRPVENWKDYLELGNSYVIELNDGRRIVKIVKKGSDKEHFLLVSVNPEFEPQEIPLSIIEHVFLVKMMLKKEGA